MLLLASTACTTGESIRVRERGEVLFAGRIRKTNLVAVRTTPHRDRRRAWRLRHERRLHHTRRLPDYRVTVGYAALVTDIGVGDLVIRPKLGVGAIDFAVAGQTTTVGDDGLGAIFGIESRYRFVPALDVFVRATSFQRSSLDASMLEAGIGFYPDPHVALELGYGRAGMVVDDASDIFNTNDEADVEVQGLLLSLSLQL